MGFEKTADGDKPNKIGWPKRKCKAAVLLYSNLLAYWAGHVLF